jgi:hypothetical protein
MTRARTVSTPRIGTPTNTDVVAFVFGSEWPPFTQPLTTSPGGVNPQASHLWKPHVFICRPPTWWPG